jgi:hypothetical protein
LSDDEDDAHEEICQESKDDKEIERCDRRSIVREDMTRDEGCLPYRNQIVVVAGFCEWTGVTNVDTEGSGIEKQRAILLNDGTHSRRIPRRQGQRWPYFDPLTPKQPREELNKLVREPVVLTSDASDPTKVHVRLWTIYCTL